MLCGRQELVAGRPGRLLYNSAVGPLHWLSFDDGTSPSLRFGFNGWANGSQEVVVRTFPRQVTDASRPGLAGMCWLHLHSAACWYLTYSLRVKVSRLAVAQGVQIGACRWIA